MPTPSLNPDKNLYSVAPVGTVIIIGRQGTLKSGLTRDSALNLITWLILASDAKPAEIAALMKDACTPNVAIVGKPQALPPAQPERQLSPPVAIPPAGNTVREFIGDIDEEEGASIVAARPPAALKTEPVNPENTIEAWGRAAK